MGRRRSSGRTRLAVVAGIGAAVVAAVTVAGLIAARAKVRGDTPGERIASIGRIAADRPSGASGALAAAVDDPDPGVRVAALTALARFVSPRHRPVIEKALVDPDGEVRRAAAATLGQYGDSAAVERLIELVQADSDTDAQLGALAGLRCCDDPRSIVTLLHIAETHGNMAVREQAMRSLLGKLGATLGKAHTPRDPRRWRDLVQRLKRSRPVRDAYAATATPLVMRPGDEIGGRLHPDRPVTPGPAPQPK